MLCCFTLEPTTSNLEEVFLTIVSEVSSIIDNIHQWNSSVKIILARIILRTDNLTLSQTTATYDDALEAMVSTRADRNNIIVVNMENALNYPDDLGPDSIHPTMQDTQRWPQFGMML